MSEVFVSTVHPAIGRLYWVFTSNADCNYPDHYSLTDWSELATRFPKDGEIMTTTTGCIDHISRRFSNRMTPTATMSSTRTKKLGVWSSGFRDCLLAYRPKAGRQLRNSGTGCLVQFG